MNVFTKETPETTPPSIKLSIFKTKIYCQFFFNSTFAVFFFIFIIIPFFHFYMHMKINAPMTHDSLSHLKYFFLLNLVIFEGLILK